MDVAIESRDEPDSAITRVADAALTAAERRAEEEGMQLRQAVVLLHVAGQPDGEDDSAIGSGGDIQTEKELLDMMLTHVQAVAAACGIDIAVTPPIERNWG